MVLFKIHAIVMVPLAAIRDTSPPCTSPTLAPGEISCINERGQFEHGTVFGACRGIDDYVEISITGRLAVKNSVVSTYYGSFAFLFDLMSNNKKQLMKYNSCPSE